MLAEKVETREEFEQAREMGYDYFQGYFFSKPVIISKKDVPGFKINQLRMLQKVNEEEIDFDGLSDLIQSDMSMVYKVLRLTNSAAFGLRNQVTSIRQALGFLGEKGIRKWASILLVAGLAQDKARELVVSSLVRARFCELLSKAPAWSDRGPSLFLVGLFSRIDAIVGRPLQEVLGELPLKQDISGAILREGELQTALDLIEALERGNWSDISRLAADIKIDESALQDMYFDAVKWPLLFE